MKPAPTTTTRGVPARSARNPRASATAAQNVNAFEALPKRQTPGNTSRRDQQTLVADTLAIFEK